MRFDLRLGIRAKYDALHDNTRTIASYRNLRITLRDDTSRSA